MILAARLLVLQAILARLSFSPLDCSRAKPSLGLLAARLLATLSLASAADLLAARLLATLSLASAADLLAARLLARLISLAARLLAKQRWPSSRG